MVKTRKKRQKGGRVSLEFPKPVVSTTSASDAITGAMHKQAESNKEVSQLNKDFGQENKYINNSYFFLFKF